MNLLQKFLIICSGSNLSVLKKSPTEWNKHAGVGGVILFTAIFATLSATYAMYTVFDSWPTAILVGIIWGLMIFNLDRYIVSSMKGHSGTGRKLVQTLPRLLLALFLGIVISKPLELKIFDKEINKQLNLIINRNKQEIADSIQIRYDMLASHYNEQGKSIEGQLKNLQDAYDQSELELEKEILGTQTETTSGKEGYGPNAKRKAEIKAERKLALENFQQENRSQLDSIAAAQANIQRNKEKEIAASSQVEDGYTGILARLHAYNELTEKYPIMQWASLFIMGIFVMLEIAPVLVKLMSPNGPYEDLMQWSDYQAHSYSKENIAKEELKSDHRVKTLEQKIATDNSYF